MITAMGDFDWRGNVFRKATCFVLVAITALLLGEGPAYAKGGDPSKIGDKLYDIVSPNVKSFWKIALIVGVLVTIFGKIKPGLIVAFYVCIVLSGAVIFNPGGVGDMATNIGNKLF
jgi:hypothetical protein